MVHEKEKKKKTEGKRELAVRVVNGQEHATYRAGEQADEELAGIHIGLHECSKLWNLDNHHPNDSQGEIQPKQSPDELHKTANGSTKPFCPPEESTRRG
jgi:hypothetical protein